MSMTEDERIVNVSTDDVYKKYREQTEAELARLRHAVAQAEAAIDSLLAERGELRAQLSRSASLPQPVLEQDRRVPEAPGAGQQRRHAAP